MFTYSQDYKYSEDFADGVKASVLAALVKEKIIKEDIAEDWCENHTIILKKKTIFKTISDKWFKEASLKDSEGDYVIVVKKV